MIVRVFPTMRRLRTWESTPSPPTELADEGLDTFFKEVAGDESQMMTFGELCRKVATERAPRPSEASTPAPSHVQDDEKTIPQPPDILQGKAKSSKPVAEALTDKSKSCAIRYHRHLI